MNPILTKEIVVLIYNTDQERNQGNNILHKSQNNIKYLGDTLTKQLKDMYDNTFKSFKKEIGECIRSWKDFSCP